MHFSHITLVRLFIPFVAGIIVFLQVNIFFSLATILITIATLVALVVVVYQFFTRNIRIAYLYGITINVFLAVSGYVIAQNHYQLKSPDHFSHFQQHNGMLRIRVTEPVAEKTNTFQVVGRVTHFVSDSISQVVTGRLIIWLQKDSLAASINYGDIILIGNNYQETRPPQNPNSFNYKKFLERQNIFHQAYRKSGEWFPAARNEGNIVVKLAHQMRNHALQTLEANNIKGRDFAVASALLLGYREYLDEDLQREFSGSGAMHILCVSGLHVGIIFMALNLMLGFITRLPRGKYFKSTIIIVLIWFYAAITGFAPSVLRASTMFSFVAIGQTFDRNTNIYNTLAGSAMFLAFIDPYIISRLGFQLSYIAVLSIVSLQPVISRQLYFKNKILRGLWGIITVSIAAQLGTAPLAMYYFNQFPNYFLLTNIIVIPLTDLIIKGGILFFILSPVPVISYYAGIALSAIVWVLHSAVRIIEGLPGSTTTGISIAYHQQLLLMIILGFMTLFFQNRKRKYIFLLLIGFLVFSLSVAFGKIEIINRKQLVVYHVSGATAVDVFSSDNCFSIGCQQLMDNPKAISFNLARNRLTLGAKKIETVLLTDTTNIKTSTLAIKNNFLITGGFTLKFIERYTPMFPHSGELLLEPDVILIRQNPRLDMASLAVTQPAGLYVFDSSNSLTRQRSWLQQCDSLGINCWSVSLQGACIIDL